MSAKVNKKAQQKRIAKKVKRTKRAKPVLPSNVGIGSTHNAFSAMRSGDVLQAAFETAQKSGKTRPFTSAEAKAAMDDILRNVIPAHAMIAIYKDALDNDVVDKLLPEELIDRINASVVRIFENMEAVNKLIAADVPQEDYASIYLDLLTAAMHFTQTDIPEALELLSPWSDKINKHRDKMIEAVMLASVKELSPNHPYDLQFQHDYFMSIVDQYATPAAA